MRLSLEFFPPASDAMAARLWQAMERLAGLGPRFVSITYGAGGSTRERTHAAVRRILDETDLTPAPHLTCVGATRAEVDAIARRYRQMGVRHLVALRGDAPQGEGQHGPADGGYVWASELVAGLARVGGFEIAVAAYPEVHPEARSAADDLDNLRRKVDAGACSAITQFFFEADTFLRFRDRVADAGIAVELVPGILPIARFGQTLKFAQSCGASVPDWLRDKFSGVADDSDEHQRLAADTASKMCLQLRDAGVDGFHFYTLNRSALCLEVCAALAS